MLVVTDRCEVRIHRMVSAGNYTVSDTAVKSGRASAAGEQGFDACQVLVSVYSGMRRDSGDRDADAVTVPKCAQLLERLELLDRCRRKPGIAGEKSAAVCINADVAVDRQALRNCADTIGKCVACIGNRCAAEVKRVVVPVEHDLHYVGVRQLGSFSCRAARGRDCGVRAFGKLLGDGAYELRLDQRLVALHVDDDALRRIAAQGGNFSNAVGARRVIRAGQHRRVTMLLGRLRDSSMVCRYYDLCGTACAGLVGNPYHHRFAGDVEQRLARQPRRRVTRGDDYDEGGHA